MLSTKPVEAGPPPLPPKQQSVGIRLRGGDSSRRVLECTGLALTGLTEPFDFSLWFGERVAILGPNGVGKSHLLRLLAGESIDTEGRFRIGPRVEPGYFSQHHTAVNPDVTALDFIESLSIPEERAMAMLARYGLHAAANRPVGSMSGGQQARLQVLALECHGSNLLLLDEPTDNLDLESAEALQTALDQFEGTVLAVTHDRWFMETFDRFVIMDYSGTVREAPDYHAAIEIISVDDPRDMAATAIRLRAIDLTEGPRSSSRGI